jgi:hypothetical protein
MVDTFLLVGELEMPIIQQQRQFIDFIDIRFVLETFFF